MKNSVWIVIALVTGIVGFLMGYSVSSFTGTRRAAEVARAAPAAAAPAPAQKADAGGYGAAAPSAAP